MQSDHPYGVCYICEEPYVRSGSQSHTDSTPPECRCTRVYGSVQEGAKRACAAGKHVPGVNGMHCRYCGRMV